MNADVKQALLNLQGEDGRVLPVDVVEEARDPASPLHSHFDWNDSVAAEKYRLVQARQLIARITIIHEVAPDEYVKVRRLVAVRSDGGGYRSIESVASSPPLRESLLNQLAMELTALRARFAAFEKILKLPLFFKEMDSVIRRAEREKRARSERPRRKRKAAA